MYLYVPGGLRPAGFLCIRPFPKGFEGDEVRSADQKKNEPLGRTGGGLATRKDRTIGEALRRVYQDAADERVPDDLLDLLSKLD
ncbi:hypothetical protein DAH68_12080 [Sphingomonas koreensis]|jgi:hypothetical protein|nr:hypothetical protein BDW16_3489 [Sphingomonas koreensis]RSU21735.1 hypothetical protein CA225_20960 [Sphingomonas koreensis]RSY69601.1 hypothetical protein DAH68_12080 [Sphingomonas koreensis]